VNVCGSSRWQRQQFSACTGVFIGRQSIGLAGVVYFQTIVLLLVGSLTLNPEPCIAQRDSDFSNDKTGKRDIFTIIWGAVNEKKDHSIWLVTKPSLVDTCIEVTKNLTSVTRQR
jgi:hypothetical protein